MASQVFSYTGALQTFVVPVGVTVIDVDVAGAQGGSGSSGIYGGKGGRVQAKLTVTPGETLNIYVGQQPAGATGGFNGGGNGGSSVYAGGGASDIRQGGNALADRKIIGGGGGGVGNYGNGGGGGGYTSGAAGFGYEICGYGCSMYAAGGGGGTQSAGGSGGTGYGGTAGSAGTLGGGGAGANTVGGGGGGGYYGGGGGESVGSSYGGSGGGGSNFTAAGVTLVTHTNDHKTGNGRVVITYFTNLSNLDVRVGSFVKNNTTGTQSITGVGFTPKAVIVWSGGNRNINLLDSSIYHTYGFSSGSSNSYAVGGYEPINNAPVVTARRMAAKLITVPNSAGNGVLYEADLSSFDADGFTLNWTTNAALPAYISYLAIGGTDVSARAVNWTTPTATGNKAVTGVGFKPDLVLHCSDFVSSALPASATDHSFALGAMNSTGQWTNSLFSVSNANPTNTQLSQYTDGCLVQINASHALEFKAGYVSMDSDGFTTNFSHTQGTARQVVSLCLKGLSSKVGNFNKVTTAAPVTQTVTGTGFEPKGLLMSSTYLVSPSTTGTMSDMGIGAASYTPRARSSAVTSYDAFTYTYAYSYFNDNDVFVKGQGGGYQAIAEVSTLDSNGFTLNWRVNDAAASQMLYIALGDQPASSRSHQMIT